VFFQALFKLRWWLYNPQCSHWLSTEKLEAQYGLSP